MTAPSTPPPAVRFAAVRKRYGDTVAVDGVSFDVARGEFFSILGPSGCGKSTTLRLLAGFERPDEGEIHLNGDRIDGRRPWERPLAMVFQSYALFPHLSVERNVAFGLERRKLPRTEIETRVRRALELVRLDPGAFGRRSPRHLSGGQRQRVALARALVLEPPVLLLDEPLGALDQKLRKEMQVELRALNRQLGITFVYVTHDQEEALAMSDRVAVMTDGRLAQVGTPVEVYERPRTAFVAGFLGEANLLAGDDGARLAVRPEWMEILRPDTPLSSGAVARAGEVRDVVYLGERARAVVRLESGEDVVVALPPRSAAGGRGGWRPGDRAVVAWRPGDARALEEEP
ncbi:MAG TPA: ABC transporter ATP-binding protein [Gemmatimonadota bacterium]|nr:ABC transporter ATP-binding protein [Gemmatimonadota bacterium]